MNAESAPKVVYPSMITSTSIKTLCKTQREGVRKMKLTYASLPPSLVHAEHGDVSSIRDGFVGALLTYNGAYGFVGRRVRVCLEGADKGI